MTNFGPKIDADDVQRNVDAGVDRIVFALESEKADTVLPELDRIAGQRDFDVVIRHATQRYRIGDLRPTRLSGALRAFVVEPLRLGGARDVVDILE